MQMGLPIFCGLTLQTKGFPNRVFCSAGCHRQFICHVRHLADFINSAGVNHGIVYFGNVCFHWHHHRQRYFPVHSVNAADGASNARKVEIREPRHAGFLKNPASGFFGNQQDRFFAALVAALMRLSFCAASMIGAITVIFTEKDVSMFVLAKIAALIFWGVLLFWTGALLSKGE
ncbi:hypothetical protein E4O93_22440 [Diaphorobacter sp. DS2]|nr:hypothetical protein E4O93_22440 [Diaphorobacter sp. DS2]